MAVWPAGGVGLAALLLSPRRLWPTILAALFLTGNAANLMTGRPLFNSVGFMTANVIESLACAWLMVKWGGSDISFGRVREVTALIFAATAVNAFTALVGAGTATIAGMAPFWSFWQTWFVADGLGILLVAPLVVTWSSFRDLSAGERRSWAIETTLFMAIWCAAAWMTFHVHPEHSYFSPQPYVFVALLAWAALRPGRRCVTLALVTLAVAALTSDAVSVGPLLWGGDTHTERVLLVQMYLACTAFTGLLLAGSYSESKAARLAAIDSEARIRAIGDNLPGGMVYQVVRDHDGAMRFTYVSGAIEKFGGVTAEEALRDPASLYTTIPEILVVPRRFLKRTGPGLAFALVAAEGGAVILMDVVRQTSREGAGRRPEAETKSLQKRTTG
jgi:integral membrane sensor domain MASE1